MSLSAYSSQASNLDQPNARKSSRARQESTSFAVQHTCTSSGIDRGRSVLWFALDPAIHRVVVVIAPFARAALSAHDQTFSCACLEGVGVRHLSDAALIGVAGNAPFVIMGQVPAPARFRILFFVSGVFRAALRGDDLPGPFSHRRRGLDACEGSASTNIAFEHQHALLRR